MTLRNAAAIDRWLSIDPDPDTAAVLEHLLRTDPEAADVLFDGRIAFGTAGLRAALGPGPRRMNRLVVRQTTEGLMRWLDAGATVVIGFDARHQSDRFAADVAEVVAACGGNAELLGGPTPTPVLARAVLDRCADAGVMITASHNPPADNGYKLYLGDGIQLVAPADAEIASLIDEVARSGAAPEAKPAGTITTLDDAPSAQHRAVATGQMRGSERQIGIVYTAMHGVGGEHLLACFAEAGFPTPTVVEQQFIPDPDFPTVAFPNPEEPGALNLAFETANATPGTDVILANDPDADRLAVAIADPEAEQGWRRLTGDEVGALFLDHLLAARPADAGPAVVASSIVSSRQIEALAAASGVESVRTLTGFKWVARPMVEQPEVTYLFGYEEALGYCVGDVVRDKDGISAALVFAELAAKAKAEGVSLWQRLDAIAARTGLYTTAQATISLAGMDDAEAERIKAAAMAIRPCEIGGIAVADSEDLSEGRTLPPTAGLVLLLADETRVILRPSGTEPKLKVYLEAIDRQFTPQNANQARLRAQRKLDELAESVRALIA